MWSARMTGLANVRVAKLLAIFSLCLLTACRSELFSKLEEADANAVLDVLYSEGIPAYKVGDSGEAGRFKIEVEDDQLQRALHVAREHGVPRQRFASMGDLFKKEGLVSSPSEERLRYIFAVSQELASTLSQIDGVISARVHPVIPANDPLAEKVRPASAAVFIKHKADADLQQMAPAIKTLVTRSIEGLSADNVSLTFFAVAAQRAPSRAAADATASPPGSGGTVVAVLVAALALCAGVLSAVLGAKWWRSRAQPAASGAGVSGRARAPLPMSHAEPVRSDPATAAVAVPTSEESLARS